MSSVRQLLVAWLVLSNLMSPTEMAAKASWGKIGTVELLVFGSSIIFYQSFCSSVFSGSQ